MARSPSFFTAESLEEFLQTDNVPKVDEPTTSSETVPAVTPDTLFFLKIDRNASDRREASLGIGDEQFEAEFYGHRVIDVIRELLDRPLSRMRIEGEEPEELLDVELRSLHLLKAKVARERAVDVLCDMFGIAICRVVEQREGWTLTCSNPQLTDMSDLGGGSSMDASKDQFTGSNITIDELTDYLEFLMKCILFNETHLAGKYDFVLPVETFDQTRRALEEEYGIKVESAVREVEIVILRMADAAIGCAGIRRRDLDRCQTTLILAEPSRHGAAAPPNTRRSSPYLTFRHLRAYWTVGVDRRRSLRNGVAMDDTSSPLTPYIGFPPEIF